MVGGPRYDARVLASKVEELFGSTRADAKRAIAQTRSLTRNISIVMKLRSDVRADLAERLDQAMVAHGETANPGGNASPRPAGSDAVSTIAAAGHSRWQRGFMVAVAVVMLGGIGAGLAYTLSRPERQQAARPT